MPATTWNSGGEAGHDANDASPHLPILMPNGSGKPNRTTVGGEEANYLVYFLSRRSQHTQF